MTLNMILTFCITVFVGLIGGDAFAQDCDRYQWACQGWTGPRLPSNTRGAPLQISPSPQLGGEPAATSLKICGTVRQSLRASNRRALSHSGGAFVGCRPDDFCEKLSTILRANQPARSSSILIIIFFIWWREKGGHCATELEWGAKVLAGRVWRWSMTSRHGPTGIRPRRWFSGSLNSGGNSPNYGADWACLAGHAILWVPGPCISGKATKTHSFAFMEQMSPGRLEKACHQGVFA